MKWRLWRLLYKSYKLYRSHRKGDRSWSSPSAYLHPRDSLRRPPSCRLTILLLVPCVSRAMQPLAFALSALCLSAGALGHLDKASYNQLRALERRQDSLVKCRAPLQSRHEPRLARLHHRRQQILLDNELTSEVRLNKEEPSGMSIPSNYRPI